MNAISEISMTRTCAADLTKQINTASENLAGMLKRAHDEKAWQALGYPDWKSYVSAEIKFSQRRVFQLIDFEEIKEQVNNCSLPPITKESVTRELKAVPPEQRAEKYAKAVEISGGKAPTAATVKAVIEAEVVKVSPARLPKYTPAIAAGIADNAISMLGTIHRTDSTRTEAFIKVRDYCEAMLSKSEPVTTDGIAYAEKAIRCLEKIKYNDADKRRAYKAVSDWLKLRGASL